MSTTGPSNAQNELPIGVTNTRYSFIRGINLSAVRRLRKTKSTSMIQAVDVPQQPEDSQSLDEINQSHSIDHSPSLTPKTGKFSKVISRFTSSRRRASLYEAPAPKELLPTGNTCVVCQDPIMGVEVRGACGHFLDKACALLLFELALKDETLFPPSCCQRRISFTKVRPHMTTELVELFREKKREFRTLKRVYCAKPSCSRFLAPVPTGVMKFRSKIYSCSCGTRTCSQCKAIVEPGVKHGCETNDGNSEVLSLSEKQNWARCPGCQNMVELRSGCYHMTCRCKTEFCYLCQARWKRCGCPQMGRATRWEDEVVAQPVRAVVRQAQVSNRLTVDHPPNPSQGSIALGANLFIAFLVILLLATTVLDF
ncbi:hypothetical protein JAAARDRAFT_205343 [Jaapia argillacea MUCL 33604]|uniref:RBR-type E3 ubiquitin transferase n=1 Tax=Jaapia argillacea MUCL 33604 TaxID=933084 RepID=A0A067PZY9_9AGAM|nr:hypothetical protein JAAARDRAFT_205343 [Jaapia argillacea MUCL 33604]